MRISWSGRAKRLSIWEACWEIGPAWAPPVRFLLAGRLVVRRGSAERGMDSGPGADILPVVVVVGGDDFFCVYRA